MAGMRHWKIGMLFGLGFCFLNPSAFAQEKGKAGKKAKAIKEAKVELRATVNRAYVFINVKTSSQSIMYSVSKTNGAFYAAYTKKGGSKKVYRSKNEQTLKKDHPAIYDEYAKYRIKAVPEAIRDRYEETLKKALKVAQGRLPIDLKDHMSPKAIQAIKLGADDLRTLSIVGGSKAVFTFAFDPNPQMSSEYFVEVTLEKGKMTGRAFAVS